MLRRAEAVQLCRMFDVCSAGWNPTWSQSISEVKSSKVISSILAASTWKKERFFFFFLGLFLTKVQCGIINPSPCLASQCSPLSEGESEAQRILECTHCWAQVCPGWSHRSVNVLLSSCAVSPFPYAWREVFLLPDRNYCDLKPFNLSLSLSPFFCNADESKLELNKSGTHF